MDAYQRQLEAIVGRTKDVEAYFSIIGFQGRVSQGIMFVRLTDWSKRNRTSQQVAGEVQPQFFGIPGVLAFASIPPAFGGFGFPVQYVVQNPDFALLGKTMDTLTARARAIKGLVNVNTDLRVNKPELTVAFDRDRAEDIGVPVGDIAAALQTFLGGRRVSTFTQNDKLYYVMVQLDSSERRTPSDLSGLYVRGRRGQLVQLAVTGALATLFLVRSTINLYSQIGMILLIGLVTKNSILLVEYTNQLKAHGMETVDAIIEAGRIRLRPILMTSVATIMGALPVALGLGAGSASRRPLGYAIIGGVFFSTVLTLFVVPVAYLLLD